MKLVVIFYNIGGYHAARLRATQTLALSQGWELTAVQLTDNTDQHPWGNLNQEITFGLITLLPIKSTPVSVDRGLYSRVAGTLISSCLAKLKPDAVAIPGWGFPISRQALRWCLDHKIPTILMSESKRDDEPRFWWKEIIKSWWYVQKFSAALVGGQQHKDYLTNLGLAPAKIFLGYDAVDNDYFELKANEAKDNIQLTRERYPDIPNYPYFLTVSRFIPRKNIIRLIEAYAIYRSETTGSAWDLVIAGSGSQENLIKELIAKLGLSDNVHLPGFIPYQDIGYWYGLANAHIHPALSEQWGLVVNEAQAAGLPILCSDRVGAGKELVRQGENGFLFDPTSTSDLTRAMLKIHNLNDQARLLMGNISRSIVQKFSPAVFAQGLFNCIKSF